MPKMSEAKVIVESSEALPSESDELDAYMVSVPG